jgi:hypothetical protein
VSALYTSLLTSFINDIMLHNTTGWAEELCQLKATIYHVIYCNTAVASTSLMPRAGHFELAVPKATTQLCDSPRQAPLAHLVIFAT